jgi:hypothetical protein
LRIADFKPNPQSEIHDLSRRSRDPQLKGAAISTSGSSLWPARFARSFRTPHSAFRTPQWFPRARRDCRRRCSFLRFLAIISQRRQKLWKNM